MLSQKLLKSGLENVAPAAEMAQKEPQYVPICINMSACYQTGLSSGS